jgi:uncharacterized membrane protein YccC
VAYVIMIVVGDIIVVLGTLLSDTLWASAIVMFLIVFAAAFLTVFGGYTTAFISPVALAYSLSVLYPLADLGLWPRVIGWAIGGAVAMVAALVLWPAYGGNRLRESLAAASGGIAAALESLKDGDKAESHYRDAVKALAETRQRMSAPLRPGGPLSRDVGLLHLARNLEQAADMTRRVLDGGWTPGDDEQIATICAEAFRRISAVLLGEIDATAVTQDLPHLSEALKARRVTVNAAAMRAMETGDDKAAEAVTIVRRSFPIMAISHIAVWAEAATATALGAGTAITPVSIAPEVAAIPDQLRETLSRIGRIVGKGLDPDGVIFRNSIRAAAAMTLAVLLAKLLPVDHGFWVTLGALLVLRSSASSTSATALQAILGTFVGFVLAAGIVVAFDNHDTYLLYILPFLVFLAGYTPGAVSFVVGQVSFTMLMVVLFTLIDKAGLATDLARLETVSIGAAVAAAMSLILWPRGARVALARAVAGVYRAAAEGLRTLVTGSEAARLEADRNLYTANRRADEAFGIAISEHGTKIDVDAWMALFRAPNTTHAMVDRLLPDITPWIEEACNPALGATVIHRDRVAEKLIGVAERLEHPRSKAVQRTTATHGNALANSLKQCFDAARRDGPEHIDNARLLVAWNEWFAYVEDYVASAQPQLDLVAAASQPGAWLRWSEPKVSAADSNASAGVPETAPSPSGDRTP